MSKKKLAANFISSLKLDGLIRRIGRATNNVIVLAYHRVRDFDSETYTGDVELISALPEEFTWQVKHVRDHYSPITMEQLVDHYGTGKPLPPRPVLFTFDDGFADNALVVAPILEAAGVPGHIFISTGYVGTRNHFWFDWVVRAFCESKNDHIAVETIDREWQLSGLTLRARRAAAIEFLRLIKKLPHEMALAVRNELESISGLSQSTEADRLDRPMTWEQIQDLKTKGISYGSHSVTHPILSQMSVASVTEELETSKRELEARLDDQCRTFAYPVGGKEECTDEILAAVAKAGYEVAFTYRHGVAPAQTDEPFLLKRVRVERDTRRQDFAANLALPAIFV